MDFDIIIIDIPLMDKLLDFNIAVVDKLLDFDIMVIDIMVTNNLPHINFTNFGCFIKTIKISLSIRGISIIIISKSISLKLIPLRQ